MKRKSTETYRGQRSKEKYELLKRFRIRAIEDLYKKKFFALFDNRCFRCGVEEREHKLIGEPPVLCMDHHVPMALGGHLVPGNIVALCRSCNNRKLDSAPEEFYTPNELERLQPILSHEEEVFSFSFDWEAWHGDREGYLLGLGVDPALVKELLFNPEHPDFIGVSSEQIGFAITVDLDEPDEEQR